MGIFKKMNIFKKKTKKYEKNDNITNFDIEATQNFDIEAAHVIRLIKDKNKKKWIIYINKKNIKYEGDLNIPRCFELFRQDKGDFYVNKNLIKGIRENENEILIHMSPLNNVYSFKKK